MALTQKERSKVVYQITLASLFFYIAEMKKVTQTIRASVYSPPPPTPPHPNRQCPFEQTVLQIGDSLIGDRPGAI